MRRRKGESLIPHIPELVEYISTFSELAPEDLILTGSPVGGKKRIPQLFCDRRTR
ncbi:fumarylacetoacetate hydrolase family protein [Herbaspirillum seropedicae]|uniref:fumarylacetoacetate hydrolase family protein n=1 Tax=Herbaspirillum seropedicae TaxID=964 RepID=UPI00286A69FF|nr:fumarylacetoacetate hydrolase family protein [Herbaspirillum seropedicae]